MVVSWPSRTRFKDVHLVLFFTRGASLHFWDKVTLTFEREVALYRLLRPHLGGPVDAS
jgi:hypothetical protein